MSIEALFLFRRIIPMCVDLNGIVYAQKIVERWAHKRSFSSDHLIGPFWAPGCHNHGYRQRS
jgi:hypothetical protein